MATNNQINQGLAGSSGTGNFASSTSETFTTPILGAASGSTLTYSNYATGGIVGVTTNNNAIAGVVGEFQQDVESTGVACTNDTPVEVCSLSLSAGDWDVNGGITFAYLTGTTGMSITVTLNTSVALPTIGAENNYVAQVVSIPALTSNALTVGSMRFSLSGTTTVYLVGQANLSGGSGVTATGYLQARRVR